jgi:hypothetical protein
MPRKNAPGAGRPPEWSGDMCQMRVPRKIRSELYAVGRLLDLGELTLEEIQALAESKKLTPKTTQ